MVAEERMLQRHANSETHAFTRSLPMINVVTLYTSLTCQPLNKF